ncbi:MAG TPA: pyridoxal-dependent decarboxylase [Thermomicrobiales bacterium]|nr:pyridoxal-dependent decarboxylase [Thermomicrobiales bacterium]
MSGDSSRNNPFDAGLPALERAWKLAADYIASLPERPVAQAVTAAEMEALLDEPLPETGMDPAEALEEWFRRAERGIVASSGPRFFGYVIGGTTPAALAGDWLAATIDQDAGLWDAATAAVHTERVVARWLKELFGLPMEWTGTPATGATHANLIGLAAARQWAGIQRGFDPAEDGLGGQPPIPVISSTEIHMSARKSLSTLGLGRASLRTVPAIDGRVDVGALERALDETDGACIVVANAGEVNTGAFDPLDEIADLCERHPSEAWLHVDGAFGLFAALTESKANLLGGIERADSVAVDAHKWLNVPYDSGFAFVGEERWLLDAFRIGAAYIAEGDFPDPGAQVPELSRRFRGLPMWCALKAFGRQGYRELVQRCLDNAALLGGWLEAEADFELLAPVNLNIVCFRFAPAEHDEPTRDDLNRRLVEAVQHDGRAFVTPTTWQGKGAIRAAFDNWATTPDDTRILFEALTELARGLMHETGA